MDIFEQWRGNTSTAAAILNTLQDQGVNVSYSKSREHFNVVFVNGHKRTSFTFMLGFTTDIKKLRDFIREELHPLLELNSPLAIGNKNAN